MHWKLLTVFSRFDISICVHFSVSVVHELPREVCSMVEIWILRCFIYKHYYWWVNIFVLKILKYNQHSRRMYGIFNRESNNGTIFSVLLPTNCTNNGGLLYNNVCVFVLCLYTGLYLFYVLIHFLFYLSFTLSFFAKLTSTSWCNILQ
jgi:hypothetical protein